MITPETMLMGFLTVIAIFIVSKDVLNISFSIEFTIFSAGCIFPTTFSVEAAFDRREVDTFRDKTPETRVSRVLQQQFDRVGRKQSAALISLQHLFYYIRLNSHTAMIIFELFI